MANFRHGVAFNEATNGQADIKHEMGITLSSDENEDLNKCTLTAYPRNQRCGRLIKAHPLVDTELLGE